MTREPVPVATGAPEDPTASVCRPTTGAKQRSRHWLKLGSQDVIGTWIDHYEDGSGLAWWIAGVGSIGVKFAAERGYRYVCPCPTPEQIAERERLVRALAKVVGALWEDRNDLNWYSAWDFLELLRDEEIIEMRMPDGRLAGEEDNPNDAEPELTDLGRAAIELAKEPQS